MPPDHPADSSSQSAQRAAGLHARRTMGDNARHRASEIVTEKVLRSSWFRHSEYIACYLPMRSEVDTWDIIARAWQMKKRIFAPLVEKNSPLQFREIRPDSVLEPGMMGLLEPSEGEILSARRLDVVITPVVAFDSSQHRIGMGGGYYDRTFRFLACRRHYFHPKLVGVAFACQKVEKIAPNPWDIRLFSIITEAPDA